MTTKKTTKPAGKTSERGPAIAARPRSASYEAALGVFAEALDMLHKGRPADALERFLKVAKENADEVSLAERARSYATVCERKLTPAPDAPADAESCYAGGVVAANRGEVSEAIALFDRALDLSPNEPTFLYARAAAWALQDNADRAAQDLRKAIQAAPKLRFQAVNDPDFEKVRDEAVFIDVIEPTTAGA